MSGSVSFREMMLRTVALGAALLLSACAGQGQDEENLEVSEQQSNQQGNLGEDDAAEGNGQENFVEGEEGEATAQQGAEANSATGEEGGDLNPTLNGGGADALAANPSAEAPPPPPIQETPPLNPAMDPAAQAAAPAAPAAAVPTEQSPVPGGRVRYVRQGGVQVVNAPGGSPVLTLDQGEHPVTWEENGWLKLTTGMYVPIDAMSDAGVARPSGPKTWNQ